MSQLADGWRWRSIDELTGGVRGNAVIGPFGSDLKVSDYVTQGVRLVFVRDIRSADFATDGPRITPDKAQRLRAHDVRNGDVLVTKMGDPPGDAAIYDGDEDAIITADCIRLRLSADFDSRFVAYSFGSEVLMRQVDSITSGVAQRKVSLARLRETVRVPAPSLDEQRRIAAILDRADALRAKRRQALTHLDDLTQSIFIDMFGDAVESVGLGDVISEFRYGTSSKTTGEGVPTLRIPNVVRGALDLSDLKYLPMSDPELTRLRMREGDVLFVRSNGNPKYVGRCAVFEEPQDAGPFVFASYLIRGRPDRLRVNPTFMSSYLRAPAGRAQLFARAKTSAGQYNINIEGLKAVHIPRVPMPDQNAFEDRVRLIRDRAAHLRRSKHELDILFFALQQRAFAGLL